MYWHLNKEFILWKIWDNSLVLCELVYVETGHEWYGHCILLWVLLSLFFLFERTLRYLLNWKTEKCHFPFLAARIDVELKKKMILHSFYSFPSAQPAFHFFLNFNYFPQLTSPHPLPFSSKLFLHAFLNAYPYTIWSMSPFMFWDKLKAPSPLLRVTWVAPSYLHDLPVGNVKVETSSWQLIPIRRGTMKSPVIPFGLH